MLWFLFICFFNDMTFTQFVQKKFNIIFNATFQGTNVVSTPEADSKTVPFRRVVTETVEVDPRLTDNSFEAKVNAQKLAKPRQLHVLPSVE